MKPDNGWYARFGIARINADRALLEALEAQVAAEGHTPAAPVEAATPPSAPRGEPSGHDRIAKAFGRPA